MNIQFSIDRWAAWAPGLTDSEAWLAWLAAPCPIDAEGVPALGEMPAMMRRRVERLGRVALQAAYWGLGDEPACPVVFASRYGDVTRSVELLRQLAQAEGLSPTAFSMSVHNAIGALFSIARADTTSYSALAAGAETVEAAFTEALGLLADGADTVLLVYYDEPLPELFEAFSESLSFPRAWACRLRRVSQGGISLSAGSVTSDVRPVVLPADLAALQFLLSDAHAHTHTAGARQWHWQRHV
ncbi:beta-ketoacyl synthase chain length factor [Chitinimonas naiadis]